jgi:putative FmdB family regulatory protein
MPIYEYRCTHCGHHWTAAESLEDHEQRTQPPACPSCRATAVEQVFTPFFAKTVRKS